MTHTYSIIGMHCQSCVNKTTAALRSVPGVTSAAVSLSPPEARVETSRHIPAAELDRAVQAVGDYRLADAAPSNTADADVAKAPRESLYPLFLIVAYIGGTVALAGWATGTRSPHELMRYFMAGFFLVFSFFKLLDLRGFADAYRMYDIVARAWPAWGFAYPFVELALGVAYLVDFQPTTTSVITLAVMLIGAIGVLKALLDKRAIRCACLGTALNLPMTTITLVEDLGMAAMAGVMLLTN